MSGALPLPKKLHGSNKVAQVPHSTTLIVAATAFCAAHNA